ncbi:hypothetical protein [Piscinibacter sp.]|jgi:hypothetical protein|uniref:hypothetical protein n=1 Tax=Piscinibacter sp. TaxID=1903157 RepID=UPI003559D0C9
MFAENLWHWRQSRPIGPPALLREAATVLAMMAMGICFCRPHRLLPPKVQIRSAGFCLASAMFVVAAVLRDLVLGGMSMRAAVLATGLSYGVLLLVSMAGWIAEFMLLLCTLSAVDLVASCLALTGFVDLTGEFARSVLLLWGLAAMFIAMVQLRLARKD